MNRRPILDAVRGILGRELEQSEADALDEAIDKAEASVRIGNAGRRARARGEEEAPGAWKLGQAGTKLIQSFEGCEKRRSDGSFEAYPDPGTGGKPWTIGWGTTGRDINPGLVWSRKQCDERFQHDMQRYVDDVARAIGNAPTTQAQFDAMVSFHYNTGAIGRATLTKRHKAGDYAAAAKEFGKWNKAGGRVMRGLTRRRAAEAELYASR